MNNKKYIIIIVLILIFVGVVFFLFRKKIDQPLKAFDNQAEQTTVKLEVEKQNNIEFMKSLDASLNKAKGIDKDLDELSDEEEKKLGTDPINPDTDDDGLLDGDEVNIYHTNPLKADTDGDSYKDGYEVRRGYSPSGPGKLIK